MNKKEARTLAINHRDNLDFGIRIIKSKIIIQKIEKDIRYRTAKIIGVYAPFGSEVDISTLKHQYAKFAYPRIKEDKMEFVIVDEKTKWIISKFGIKEPKNGKIVDKEIDLLIISCLAKNKNNYRLGYGKGFYDKFIKEYQPKIKIGVLFDNYELNFNEDLWDIALDDYISN
ncbi:5-formyltetrahydrofolate cyclo-ligase [Haploplasma axanthum]|uniref:5-formyltetrahydrofolate cyclo-ligase n=1 Tax=Haploplasma axanthum TaxID=29552 RepID=A0A449BBB8_HAPAX|nr:5-formyltetrahydrofolate cyclo-ligase [Haploplasma axanthum]VEU79629.1 5-formyltetrahydrofolate cyclo-ligase [Haploplasma axanthum]